jgi:putative NADH-flavin reductase
MAQPAKALPNIALDNGRQAEIVPKRRHLLVIGATRGTGKQLVQQALAAGHTVTALARDPARVEIQDERLAVMRGDVLDPATLIQAMAGCDAVVSSLGVTSAYRKPTTLYSAGMRHLIEAMRTEGVTRLIAVTAAPLGDGEGDTLAGRLLGKMMWAFIKEVYADMTRMVEIIRGSGLDWTIVRPPRLTNKPLTGHYRTAVNRNVRGGYSIARADLADACLKLLDDPIAVRAVIGIGY